MFLFLNVLNDFLRGYVKCTHYAQRSQKYMMTQWDCWGLEVCPSNLEMTTNRIIWLQHFGPTRKLVAPQQVRSTTACRTCCHLCLTFLTLLVLKGSDEDSKLRRRWSYIIIFGEKMGHCFVFSLPCLMVILLSVWCFSPRGWGHPKMTHCFYLTLEELWTHVVDTELEQRLILRRFLLVNVLTRPQQ